MSTHSIPIVVMPLIGHNLKPIIPGAISLIINIPAGDFISLSAKRNISLSIWRDSVMYAYRNDLSRDEIISHMQLTVHDIVNNMATKFYDMVHPMLETAIPNIVNQPVAIYVDIKQSNCLYLYDWVSKPRTDLNINIGYIKFPDGQSALAPANIDKKYQVKNYYKAGPCFRYLGHLLDPSASFLGFYANNPSSMITALSDYL